MEGDREREGEGERRRGDHECTCKTIKCDAMLQIRLHPDEFQAQKENKKNKKKKEEKGKKTQLRFEV